MRGNKGIDGGGGHEKRDGEGEKSGGRKQGLIPDCGHLI